MTRKIALAKHYAMAFTWAMLPRIVKGKVFEYHRKTKPSIQQLIGRN